jgi:outer membrane protein
MKKIKTVLTLILAFTIAGISHAQTSSNPYGVPDQLIELVKKAIDNYPKLKAGDAYIKMNETERSLAKAGYMPTIDADANYRYQFPTPSITFPGFGSFAFFPKNNYDLHVGANLPLWDFGRTAASVKKTLYEIQSSKDNQESAKLDLAYEVAELYVATVFYNKSIEVQKEQVAVLDTNVQIIGDRVKDGDALKYDLLSTQVRLNNAQNQLIDLQNNVRKNYEYLDLLTGQQGDGYITITELNLNTAGHESDISLDKNYQLMLLKDQLKSSEIDINSARNNWLPKLIAHGQIGYQNGYVGTNPDGSFISLNKLLLTGSVGVGLSIPIYGGDRPNYRIKIAQINVAAEKYNIEAAKLDIEKQLEQAVSDLDATRGKLKNYEAQIDQAQEALKLANIRYKAGVITNLELLTSQSNLQDSELGKIRLQFQTLESTLTIGKLGGTRFW